MINYIQGGQEITTAWFEFKRTNPEKAKSVSNFVAGFNAAKEYYERQKGREEGNSSSS